MIINIHPENKQLGYYKIDGLLLPNLQKIVAYLYKNTIVFLICLAALL